MLKQAGELCSESSPEKRSNFFLGADDDDDFDLPNGVEAGQKPEMKDAEAQVCISSSTPLWMGESGTKCRPYRELKEMMEQSPGDAVRQMSNEEVLLMIERKAIRRHQLEKELGDDARAVYIRRAWFSQLAGCESSIKNIPHEMYDYTFVSNTCCENVLGYIPIPLGYAGPLIVNGKRYFVPMATVEGCLVASTNRGCRAVETGAGITAVVYNDGMSRGPVVRFANAYQAVELLQWAKKPENFELMKNQFQQTSHYAKLKSVRCVPAGRLLFMRFVATTGDAMGMNMVSKGTEAVLKMLKEELFPDMEIVSLSGNYCTDKKPAALNWIEGRGKSVVVDAVIPEQTVRQILKTDVDSLVELNVAKNLIGSSLAGSVGGCNAHSANIVTAIFLATGQDAAQNISSSNCLTILEKHAEGDLYISVTMPTLEIGAIGGGTILPPQNACLEMMGCTSARQPGENAEQLALLIAGTVLAGELSLLSALCSGDLVRSHIRYNRSKLNLRSLSDVGSILKSTSVGSSDPTTEEILDRLRRKSTENFAAPVKFGLE